MCKYPARAQALRCDGASLRNQHPHKSLFEPQHERVSTRGGSCASVDRHPERVVARVEFLVQKRTITCPQTGSECRRQEGCRTEHECSTRANWISSRVKRIALLAHDVGVAADGSDCLTEEEVLEAILAMLHGTLDRKLHLTKEAAYRVHPVFGAVWELDFRCAAWRCHAMVVQDAAINLIRVTSRDEEDVLRRY